MVKVKPELRNALIERGLWSAFVLVCERRAAEGVKGTGAILNDAIDEVCPDLEAFKRRCRARKIGVKANSWRANDASCNGFRMLEWVVESFEHAEVVESQAPSRASWAILLAARRDEDTYRDVLKKYMDSKLKLDLAQGDTETRKLDGQAEYDILDNLDIEV